MKVTVITPTRGRPEFHEKIYKCFDAQTYKDKEMVVTDDGNLFPSPFFSTLKDPRVRYTHAESISSIGAKRTRMILEATGEIIAHFDDDDYYGPGYLETMVGLAGDSDIVKLGIWEAWRAKDLSLWQWDTRACNSPLVLVDGRTTDEHIFWWPEQHRESFVKSVSWGFGFSYVYKREAAIKSGLFADMNHGEDFDFVCRVCTAKPPEILGSEAGSIALHILHDGNTSRIFPQGKLGSINTAVSVFGEGVREYL